MLWLKRLLTPPLIVIAAFLMWAEEWLWEHLKTLTAWIGKLPIFRWCERQIVRLPPYPTMGVFLLPGAVLFPVKLGAVWLMTHGHVLLGIGVIVSAKVVGTALVARLYVICQPKLMTIGWFARLHDWLTTTRDRLYSAIKAMPLYQAARAKLSAIRQTVSHMLRVFRGRRGIGARWRAVRRWMRRRRHLRRRQSLADTN
ncbi:MAG: hypothetical protein ACKV2Q_30695 [Planctomycetaceae bacterium]